MLFTLFLWWLLNFNFDAMAKSCKGENAECKVNASEKECCENLYCKPFNPTSENGKCDWIVQPTATPVPPTNTPKPTKEPRATCTPRVTATPTPTEVVEPSVTPTDEPEPTNEPTATPEPRRAEPQEAVVIPEFHAPVCTVEVPKQAVDLKYKRSGNTVNISWQHDGTNITKWSLNFGYSPDNMPMGINYMQKEARSVDLNGITWSPVWVAVCGWNTDQCQSCISFDP